MGLPVERRLRRGADVTAVVRGGRRARAGGLVVHGAHRSLEGPATELLGPRIAFVAPRTVGTAVVRNRTRRRVQAQLTSLCSVGDLAADVDLVVRLLPAATGASSRELREQLRTALGRLGVLNRGDR